MGLWLEPEINHNSILLRLLTLSYYDVCLFIFKEKAMKFLWTELFPPSPIHMLKF